MTNHDPYPLAVRPLLATALLLTIPLLAMQLTDDVDWNVFDFVVAGVLLGGTGLAYEWVARRSTGTLHRAAAGLGLFAALLLVWVNLAVGVIGDEGDPANAMYLGVLAVGFVGALATRFRPLGMSRTLFATALAQTVVAVIAIAAGLGAPASGTWELVWGNGLFVLLFLGSALLFREAARGEPHRDAA